LWIEEAKRAFNFLGPFFYPENGGNTSFRNGGIFLPVYMTSIPEDNNISEYLYSTN
jgi:hypothetical protein